MASRAMHKTKCRHVMECLAYSLVDRTTTTSTAAATASAEEEESASTTNNDSTTALKSSSSSSPPVLSQETIDTMKSHLHPTEKILIRGIEHSVSPSVLKYVAYRRKVALRKVLREQRRLRRERSSSSSSGSSSSKSSSREKDEMAIALGEYSRECTAFARDWAVQKLL